MPTLDEDTLLIPFGTGKWSDRRLKVEDDGSFQCMAPHVLVGISERQPLRLNSAQYEFMEPPNHRELADPADQLEFVLNHMKIHCDLWGKFQNLFLDRYVQFIAAHVEENKTQLGKLIKPFGSLYQYRDWVFSAFRPLPQAHINVGSGAYATEDLIAVDFAFWSNESNRPSGNPACFPIGIVDKHTGQCWNDRHGRSPHVLKSFRRISSYVDTLMFKSSD